MTQTHFCQCSARQCNASTRVHAARLFFWLLLLIAATVKSSWAAAFTAGNVVIYRVGDGTGALLNTGAAVFLDEYTPAGALVQSLALPTTTSGANKRLVASGTASSEGLLTRSVDGKYLVLTGYDATPPNAVSLTGSAAATVNRVVGRVDAAGNIDTTTALTDFADGNNPRSAASPNGTDLYLTGGAGGVRYATLGATTSTQLSTTITNLRQAQIFGGQLYISTSSGSAVRIGTVGTGTPTTTGQAITNLPGFPVAGSPYSFFFADLDAGVSGSDTLYVADDSAAASGGGIQKYSLVGGMWVANGTITASGPRGLVGVVTGTAVALYATTGGTGSTGGGSLYAFTDSTGYNGTVTGTVTTVATAAANTAFRGVALSPVSAVVPVNQKPILTLPGGALTYTENDAPTAIDGGALVTDADSPDFATGVLTVDFSANGTADDRLTIANQGTGAGQIGISGANVTFGGTIIGTFTGGTGTTPLVVTFNTSATPAAVQVLVRAINFSNVSESPSAAARTVRFVVSDGDGGTSDAATKTINVTPVNDAPVLDLNGAATGAGFSATFTEAGGGVAIVDSGALTLSDADNTTLASTTVTINNLQNVGQETLAVVTTGTPIAATYNAATGTLTLSGTATLAEYQQVLRTATYNNTSSNPGTVARTINFVVNDGTDNSATVTASVTVTPVNDAPVLSNIETTTLNYTEGAAATPITSSLLVNDVDNANLTSATVSFTSGFVTGQDVLAFTNANGITGTLNAAGDTLTLSGPATLANYQAALRSVTYRNSSANPNTGPRTVSFRVNDGGVASNLSNIVTRDIGVISVNGTPTLNAITPNPLNISQNAALQTVNLSGIGDGDGGLQTVTITGTSSDTTIIPNPTVTYINPNTTGSLSFTPVANASGMATITVRVTDNFTPAAFIERTFVVNVAPVNQAPTISDILDTATNEDTSTNASAFTVGDAETSAANLVVTTSSSNTAVVPNASVVLGGSGANRTLTAMPAPNANGMVTITVSVSDGVNSTSDTFVLTVTPVNDAPVATDGSATTAEDTAVTIDLSPLISDIETTKANLTYSIVAPPNAAQGSVTAGSTNGTFIFTPASDFNGASTFTYKVTDTGDPAGTPANALSSTTQTITVAVTPVNDAPTISSITNQSTDEDTPTGAIAFTVNDAETPAANLTVTTSSSNTALVPNANIALGGSGVNRTLTITPATNANGSATITVTVSDGTNSAVDTFVLTVTPVNDAPIARDGSASTSEDTAVTIDVRPLVSDVETSKANLTYSIVAPPTATEGSVTAGSINGTFVFTPVADFNGTGALTYRVTDTGDPAGTPANALSSTTQTITVAVTPVNDAPTISAIANQSTNEDTPTSAIAFSVGDAETAANALTVSATSSNTALVPNANIALGGSGANRTLTITPASNLNGSTIITLSVSDGTDSASTAFTLQVLAVNDAPVAQDANVGGSKNTPLSITLVASDVDNTTLTYTVLTQPAHGTLSGTAPNLTFTPNTGFIGADAFTFRANDGALNSNTATVSITIGGQNEAPIAVNDSAQTNDNTPVDIDVLANDTDADANTLTVARVAVSANTHGTVNINPNGTVNYTPARNFSGTATFSYTVSDGALESTALVTVQVLNTNVAPIASDQSVQTDEGAAKAITLGASDANNDVLTYSIVTAPTKGTLSGAAPNLVYTPNSGFSGSDSFTFKANDGRLDSNVATVTIAVRSTNRAPVALNQSVQTGEDTPATITLGATDANNGALTFTIVTTPQNGTLSGTAPNLIYTPNANFNGSDSFTFRVDDGRLSSNTATVTLQILAVNDAPVAVTDTYPSTFRVLKVRAAEGVLANDGDIEGDKLRAKLVSGPTKGTLTLNEDGSFLYTPYASLGGADSFTYVVSDGTLDSNVATVKLGSSRALDRQPPVVTIATPRNRSTVSTLTQITGLAADVSGDRRGGATTPSGVTSVEVLIVRLRDGLTWDGRAFTRDISRLTTTLGEVPSRPTARTWRVAEPLPASSDLQSGVYQIVATAIDKDGNRSRTSSFVSVLSPDGASGGVSRVVLSSATATAARNEVRLQFSGALNPSVQANQFIVTVGGNLIELESVQVAGSTLTLGLPSGLSQPGGLITILWHAIKDANGLTLSDRNLTLAAR